MKDFMKNCLLTIGFVSLLIFVNSQVKHNESDKGCRPNSDIFNETLSDCTNRKSETTGLDCCLVTGKVDNDDISICTAIKKDLDIIKKTIEDLGQREEDQLMEAKIDCFSEKLKMPLYGLLIISLLV